jgi:hypothetical protein
VQFDKNNFTVTAVLQASAQLFSATRCYLSGELCPQFAAHDGNHGWKTIDEDVNDYSFRTFLLLIKCQYFNY